MLLGQQASVHGPYLVIKEVRGKVKGTRKKGEEVLPKAESSMTR